MKTFFIFLFVCGQSGIAMAELTKECAFADVATVERTLSPEFKGRTEGAARARCLNAGYENCVLIRDEWTMRNRYHVRGERITPRSRREIREAICQVATLCEFAASTVNSEEARNMMSLVARVDGQYDCGLGF